MDQRMNHGLAWPKSTASWAVRAKAKAKGTIPLYLTLARANSVQTRPHRSSSRGDHRAPKLWSWGPPAQRGAGKEEPPQGCKDKLEYGKIGLSVGKMRLLAQLSFIFGDLTLGFAGWSWAEGEERHHLQLTRPHSSSGTRRVSNKAPFPHVPGPSETQHHPVKVFQKTNLLLVVFQTESLPPCPSHKSARALSARLSLRG